MFKRATKVFLIIMFLLLTWLYLRFSPKLKQNKFVSSLETKLDKANIKIVDLRNQLLPKQVYDSINCRISTKFYVSVTICVHDIEKDKCI